MAIKLSDEEKRQLESDGFSNAEVTGGPTHQRYWRPDGQEVFLIPALRQSAEMRNGKRVPIGSRDANYDKGYLPTPPHPDQLQITCPHCTMWHKTQEEMDKCASSRNNFISLFEDHALKEATEEKENYSKEISGIKEQINRLEKMLETLISIQINQLGAQNGKAL